MGFLWRDLRNGLVSLRRNPGYAAVAALTLAIGIGASISMFTVMEAVLLRPLPYEGAGDMVLLWNRHERTGADKVQISGPDYLDYGDRTSAFEELAAIHNAFDSAITGETTGEQIDLAIVSANFFEFLGTRPLVGRFFAPEDTESADAGPAPVVLSNGLWTRRYGADPGLVGGTIEIDGTARQVIGVLPGDFALILPAHDGGMVGGGAFDEVDVWTTFPRSWFNEGRGMGMFRVLGRLDAGVTLTQAQLEINTVAEQLRNEYLIHEERGVYVDLYPLQADVVGDVQPVILLLFGAVGVVLLIACANAANLALTRGAGRAREVAVRAALGGTRGRIAREVLAESVALVLLSGGLGLLLAAAAVHLIVALAPANVPRIDEAAIDARTLAFALGTCAVAVVLSGVVPALRAASPQLVEALKEGGAAAGSGRAAGRRAVVVAEVALSVVLLAGGGLLLQSFANMARAPLGFDADGTMQLKVSLPANRYAGRANRARALQLHRRLRDEVAALPGVEAVGYTWPAPFAGRGADVPYAGEAGESADWGSNVALRATAGPGFFEAMNAKLLSGRLFEDADVDAGRLLVVVDDIVATRLFDTVEAAGRTIWVGSPGSSESMPYEIAGVVRHLRHEHVVGNEREVIYVLAAVADSMVVRAGGDPRVHVAAIEERLRGLDPEAAVFDVVTFARAVDDELAAARFATTLASAFAALAVALAAVGLYGVIAYTVSRRTRDFGVRLALGAGNGTILTMVLREGMQLVAAGLVVGALAATAVTRLIAGLLYGVTPTDPSTFFAVAVLLVVVTGVASYVPARRATRIDPLAALRADQ